MSQDIISVQQASTTRYIIQVGLPGFTIGQIAPLRTASTHHRYQLITSGPLKGHFVKQLGKMITIRSASALDGLY
ncbi:hypothetical protein [Deinococcus hopiensis]|uniref:hypothetical protein n=1 Tax=Deinococcus hopiensis TaxID=309885 RepID=UPI00111C0940|nr:hypothetical protein [Deinococcus hopiensis]